MSIGQSIKKGFSVAGTSRDLVAALFAFGLVWNLINIALSSRIPAEGEPDPVTAMMMTAAGIIFILLTIFFQAGSLGYVKEKVKTGASSLASFSAAGRKYYVSILAVAVVVTLIIGVFVLLAALSAGLLAENAQALAAVLAIVFAALGLSFVVMLFLAPYIVVAEDAKPFAAMKMSMGLVKKNVPALLGVSLILILIGFGFGLVLGAIFAGVAAIAQQGMVVQTIFAALSSAVNSYLGVVVTASFMSFYLALPKTASNPNN